MIDKKQKKHWPNGAKIRELRESKQWTQKGLEDEIGEACGKKTIEDAENCRHQITEQKLEAIARALGVNVNEVISTKPTEDLHNNLGLLEGTWRQIIPQQDNHPAAEDRVTLRDIGGMLSGKIQGQTPEERRIKRWEFSGRLVSQFPVIVLLIYWRTSTSSDSCGAIVLSGMNREGNCLHGFYVKLVNKTDGRVASVERGKGIIELKWSKIANS
jgi:transcriptional regulator with XRE-family HTH domain